ncbi:MAG: nucleoside-triphosphatase [Candidatus Altiarchaeota archaeon]|nr:nucleoside-triphosphatase [Candidatus Altiarchaeota archaeon]
MNIILSGSKGAGKTTVCGDVARRLGHVGGVIAPREKKGTVAVDLLTGQMHELTGKEAGSGEWMPVGECFMSIKGLNFANQAISDAIYDPDCELIIIDEIGLLEMRGMGLMVNTINALSSGKHNLLAVRGSVKKDFLLKYGMYRFHVKNLTEKNRDEITGELIDLLE